MSGKLEVIPVSEVCAQALNERVRARGLECGQEKDLGGGQTAFTVSGGGLRFAPYVLVQDSPCAVRLLVQVGEDVFGTDRVEALEVANRVNQHLTGGVSVHVDEGLALLFYRQVDCAVGLVVEHLVEAIRHLDRILTGVLWIELGESEG